MCSVDQCSISQKHLGSLHDALLASFRRKQEENHEQGPSVGSNLNLTQPQSDHVVMKSSVSIAGGSHECKALPIVPVKVKGRGCGEIITTYALLDNGSTSTWCNESLAKRLGVVGPRIEVSLSTIEKDCNPTSCHRVCLEIKDMDEIYLIELPEVLTKEKLNISTDSVACQDDANRWSHLSGIQVPERIADLHDDVMRALHFGSCSQTPGKFERWRQTKRAKMSIIRTIKSLFEQS